MTPSNSVGLSFPVCKMRINNTYIRGVNLLVFIKHFTWGLVSCPFHCPVLRSGIGKHRAMREIVSWSRIPGGGTHDGECHVKSWGALLGGITALLKGLGEKAAGRGLHSDQMGLGPTGQVFTLFS